MQNKSSDIIKLQIKGKATPAPPIGPALGQKGLNIPEFCKKYNDLVKDKDPNATYPVILHVNKDKSFTIEIREQSVSQLLLKHLGLEKGSTNPGRDTVATISTDKIIEIAKMKMPDMKIDDLNVAMKIVIGTAKSMGILLHKEK